MSDKVNQPKTLKDIADELGPPLQKVYKPPKDEVANKLTLAIILSAIAPTKEQSEKAARYSEQLINMGLNQREVETCKKRALVRLKSSDNPLAGLNKIF